jgi:hypothetical protein
MDSILINFERGNNDINAACDKIKSLFPDVTIIKNPHRDELEKIKRNEEYLDMLEQSRKDIAEGRSIAFTLEELERLTEMPIEQAKVFASKRALETGVKLWE